MSIREAIDQHDHLVEPRRKVIRNDRPHIYLGQGGLRVSFEFLAPKTTAIHMALRRALDRLRPLRPAEVSITYGLDRRTRQRTHDLVAENAGADGLGISANLTCIGSTREELDEILRRYWSHGVRKITASRGESAVGQSFVPRLGGYQTTPELVAGILSIAPFEVSVTGYPEAYESARSYHAELDYLQEKIEAGASRIITQYFFDNTRFYRFVDDVRARGISVPIIPGFVPVYNFGRMSALAQRAKVSIPDTLRYRFEGLDTDLETRRLSCAAIAAERAMDLMNHGICDLHIFTSNRGDLVYALCHMLGLRPTKVAD